jgi:uroporphyrinogen decarboxylase
MIPRERIRAALNNQLPDQIPLMCQFSFGFMNRQLKNSGITPMEFWLDADKYGEGTEVATFDDRTEKYVDDDLPVGDYFAHSEKDIFTADPSDIPSELNFINASKNCYSYIDTADPYRVFRVFEKELKGEYSIHAEVSSPLDYLLDYLNYENALMAMAIDPEKVKKILERFTAGVVKMAEGLAENCDIDAIKISSPFAGSDFISPEYYREYELPYLKSVSDAIKDKGKYSYVHTCGHINDRLEIMKEAGLSGIECLDPPPIGDVELDDAFKRIGDNMFIKGNIDSVNTLLNGTVEQIRTDVKSRIETGAVHRGFILSTACSIAPRVPRERIVMLSELIKEFGQNT